MGELLEYPYHLYYIFAKKGHLKLRHECQSKCNKSMKHVGSLPLFFLIILLSEHAEYTTNKLRHGRLFVLTFFLYKIIANHTFRGSSPARHERHLVVQVVPTGQAGWSSECVTQVGRE